MRPRQRGEVVVVGVGQRARGEREEPRAETVGALGRPAHDVMELERVEDAIDGGARQAEEIDQLADARPVVALLEQASTSIIRSITGMRCLAMGSVVISPLPRDA